MPVETRSAESVQEGIMLNEPQFLLNARKVECACRGALVALTAPALEEDD